MKICLFDSWNLKFAAPIRDHWISLGHQVLVNPQWGAMQESDLNFFYECDNTAIEGSKQSHVGTIIVQCVDIEIYSGQHLGVDWSQVNGTIFMANHIRDKVLREIEVPTNFNYSIIKPGIDLTKWTLKEGISDTPVRKIAYVVGDKRIWDVKRLDIAFQLLKDLIDHGQNIWQLHIRGTYSTHEQYNAYCKYLEKDLKLDGHVFWYEDRIEDMNAWLEDKDYILVPSTKEAFSYATAEAMAKGIKPILNNWEGSKETWPGFICETQGQMLYEFLKGNYEPEKYRQFVVDNYDQERYFKDLDEFLGMGVI